MSDKVCPNCNGSGDNPDMPYEVPCPQCGGKRTAGPVSINEILNDAMALAFPTNPDVLKAIIALKDTVMALANHIDEQDLRIKALEDKLGIGASA